MKTYNLLLVAVCVAMSATATAQQENVTQEESFEVETTRIQSNQELPKILYVVPWKDVTGGTNQTQQKLALHDFFGDLYEPLIPSNAAIKDSTPKSVTEETKSE